MNELAGKDRLIVALDVDSHKRAMHLVEELSNVSLFKVGYQLLMTGNILGFIDKFRERREGRGQIFLDIKIASDIGNTLVAIMKNPAIKFLTLTEARVSALTRNTINTARTFRGSGAQGKLAPYPHLLMVPFLSSQDVTDLEQTEGRTDLNAFIVEQGKRMIEAGCDGLIVSGDAIKLCRDTFRDIDIVSPGIRPTWASRDDQKRVTTPTEAIEMGSDYLVVGRPIIKATDPHKAAQEIIGEIDQALEKRGNKRASSGSSTPQSFAMTAKPRE